MTADLARSNAELERFASVASHDLREPLRSVAGFMRLLERRRGTRLDPEARAWIASALDGTRRMSALIGDLLEYSRAGAGEPDATGDLAGRLGDRDAQPLRRDPRRGRDRDRRSAAARRRLAGRAQPGRAEPARRTRSSTAARPRPSCTRAPSAAARAWALTVADNGIGIDPRHHEHGLRALRRLHREDEYEGTGMGLSLVKKVAEARGGSVSVESAPGEGARFTLVLPAAAAGRPGDPRGLDPGGSTGPRGRSRTRWNERFAMTSQQIRSSAAAAAGVVARILALDGCGSGDELATSSAPTRSATATATPEPTAALLGRWTRRMTARDSRLAGSGYPTGTFPASTSTATAA